MSTEADEERKRIAALAREVAAGYDAAGTAAYEDRATRYLEGWIEGREEFSMAEALRGFADEIDPPAERSNGSPPPTEKDV